MGFFSGLLKAAGPISAMIPGVGPLASAAIGAVGSGIGGSMDAKDQNKANSAINAQSVDLANTAHQREVRDLMAAGLNPMLSYHTSGSSTPQMIHMENTADSANRSMATSSQNALVSSQIRNQESQTDLNSASAAKVRAETLNVPLAGKNLEAQTSKINPEIQQILSSSSLNSVSYNKVLKEIELLDSQNRLTKANVIEVLSKTNLNNAEVSRISAEIPMINSKSFFAGSAETGAKTVGEALGTSAGAAHMYVEDFIASMRKRRSAYEHRSR